MPFLLQYFGISKSTEVLLLILIGIYYTIFDCASLEFSVKLRRIWEVRFRLNSFSEEIEMFIKYLLWTVVLVQSFTTPLYLAFSVVVLWPAIFEDRPTLLIPWLVTGFAKNVMPSVISLVVGTYTCFATDFQKPACWDFILAQLINHAPTIYVFLCVRSFYKDLQSTSQNAIEPNQPQLVKEIVVRRRKARLMKGYPDVFYESGIEKDMQLRCVSTFEDLMQSVTETGGPKKAKSFDSLLQSIVSRAEENKWKKMFDRSQMHFSKTEIRETVMRNFKITEEYIHLAKIRQNEEYQRILSEDVLINPSQGQDPIGNDNFDTGSTATLTSTCSTDAETQICPVLNYSATSLVDKTIETNMSLVDKSIETNTSLVDKSIETKTSLVDKSIETNTSLVDKSIETNTSLDDLSRRTGRSLSPLPLPKLQTTPVFYIEILDSARTASGKKDVQRVDFSCQVSTLSRKILNSPPMEFLRFLPESPSLSYRICASTSALMTRRDSSTQEIETSVAEYCVSSP